MQLLTQSSVSVEVDQRIAAHIDGFGIAGSCQHALHTVLFRVDSLRSSRGCVRPGRPLMFFIGRLARVQRVWRVVRDAV